MKPQIVVLTILLIISIICNIILLQPGGEEQVAPEQGTPVITATDVNNIQSVTSRLYTDLNRSSDKEVDWVVSSSKRYLMQLNFLKDKAESENATKTSEAIQNIINSTKNRLDKLAQLEGVDILAPNRPREETTYQQRQERHRRLLRQQKSSEPNSDNN